MLKLSKTTHLKIDCKLHNRYQKLKSKKESKKELFVKEKENTLNLPPKKTNRTLKELKEDSFFKIKQKANDSIKSSLDFAKNTSEKIEENIKEGIEKAKESSIVQEVQSKTTQIKSMDQKDKNKYKRKFILGLVRVRDVIFGLFEKFVGRIKVGTQYGKSSIDLLSELAKLKELGIITEKEFTVKKKEILDRI